MQKRKASELVLDFDLYPRNNVDTQNVKTLVKTLVDAIAAGAELPPVIIDQKSKRVIDGFHRVRAFLRHNGPDAEIIVIEKNYKDDAAMFLDAMRYNASHGAKLDQCDRTRCTIIAERLSIPLDVVAGALHMSADKLGALKADRTATTSAGLSVALKRTVSRFAGSSLTQRQIETNQRLSGMNQSFYANQLIDLIESKMLDLEDERLMERLLVLNGLLDSVLAPSTERGDTMTRSLTTALQEPAPC